MFPKTALITGGATGIGRYIALGCASRGANIAICDIDSDALESTRTELSAAGVGVLAEECDVRDEAQVADFVEKTQATFGGIEYLVNNAAIVPHFQWGVPRWPRVRDMDFDFWTKVLGTNVSGTFLVSKHVIPHMERQRDGHIVNLYGGGAPTPPGALAYIVTKEALVAFSRYLAEEVRESGICVLSLSPGGAIATERAPEDVRQRMPGPDLAGDRFLLAAEADMSLSGHLVDLVDGRLVAVDR